MALKPIRIWAFLVLVSLACQPAWSQTRKRVDRSTDYLTFLPSVTGMAISLYHHDFQGMKQFAFSGATSLAANYLLELAVKKNRPDGTGEHAFPSTHTTVSFMGSTFVQQRYGWKWGLPCYLVSTYVAWGRVYAKKHDVWDVLAGAAIGAGCSFIYTRKFTKNRDFVISPAVIHRSPGIYFSSRI